MANPQSRILGDAQNIVSDGKLSKHFKMARGGKRVKERPSVDSGRKDAVMKKQHPVAKGEQLTVG